MEYPEKLRYSKEHEWAIVENAIVTIGITDYAQGELGDVVYVELPAVDSQVKAGETFGVVESVKSVSDLYSPVSGKVAEIIGIGTGDAEQLPLRTGMGDKGGVRRRKRTG